jgi:prolyl 4-hydroxylase
MMLRMLRPLFPLLLLLAAWYFMVVNASMAANAGTCVMDVDGNCMDDEATSNQNDCQDAETACKMWAESGECEANPKYMLNNCRVSCETCSMTPKEIQKMIDERLEENTDDMDLEETPWGVAQDVEDDDETRRIIAETEEYMKNVVFVDPKYESVKDQCKNRNSQCVFWASSGECEANPAFMTLQCAPVCQTCEKISFEARCPWDPETTPNALKPGDLNKLFERLTTDPHYSQYKPVIHSRPEPLEIAKNGDKDAPVPKEGPWVVTLDDFVTEEECNVLINHGAVEGYEISEDVGEQVRREIAHTLC